MNAHTPPPWFLDQFEDGSYLITPRDGFSIAPLKARPGFDHDLPNFTLMAAAPELLDALERLVDDLEESHADELNADHYGDDPGECSYCRTIALARAAIMKATTPPKP